MPPPKPPQPKPDPPKEELPDDPWGHLSDIQWHRFTGLLSLHFAPQQAELLVDLPDVIHEAERLLAKGMPVDLVFDQLT